MTIGERIRNIRTKAGISQKELADTLNTTTVSISHWETDSRGQKTDILRRIAEALNVSLADLLDLSPEESEIVNKNERMITEFEKRLQSAEQDSETSDIVESWEKQLGMAKELLEENIAPARLRQQVALAKRKEEELKSSETQGSNKAADYEHKILSLLQKRSLKQQDMLPGERIIWEQIISLVCQITDTTDLKKRDASPERLLTIFEELNENGQQEAIKRIEEMVYVPAYRKTAD